MSMPRDIKPVAPLSLTVPAKPEMISGVRRSVAAHVRALAFDEDDIDAITLAVGEACSNAVRYGGANAPDPTMHITCLEPSPKQVQIDIQNQGNGFHPDLAVLSTFPDASRLQTHGRGFALMSGLVDHVEVLSDGKNTTVRLLKRASVR